MTVREGLLEGMTLDMWRMLQEMEGGGGASGGANSARMAPGKQGVWHVGEPEAGGEGTVWEWRGGVEAAQEGRGQAQEHRVPGKEFQQGRVRVVNASSQAPKPCSCLALPSSLDSVS